jgi:hypothetical protein
MRLDDELPDERHGGQADDAGVQEDRPVGAVGAMAEEQARRH